jgi:hypothetical protein
VAVSADGRRAVSASWDKTLKVWDVGSGHVEAAFTCDSAAQCCAFDGGRTIVADDAAGRVHFLFLELQSRAKYLPLEPSHPNTSKTPPLSYKVESRLMTMHRTVQIQTALNNG